VDLYFEGQLTTQRTARQTLRQDEDYMEGHPAGADVPGIPGYRPEPDTEETAYPDSCGLPD
jgi:hypothetical protein